MVAAAVPELAAWLRAARQCGYVVGAVEVEVLPRGELAAAVALRWLGSSGVDAVTSRECVGEAQLRALWGALAQQPAAREGGLEA